MDLIKATFEVFVKLITNKYVIISATLAILVDILYPRFRGFMGEFWVRQELKKLPKDKYRVLNNIMIEENNNTHQIDHIVVSQYGIFVIEMKNYYGLILGDEYKNKWIQYLGKKRSYFQNPIHQNYGHIKVLEELLNLNNNLFIPIICFSNQTKLKITTKTSVVHLDYLVKAIKNYKNIIIDSDIDLIYDKIMNLNITDKSERKKHVKNIRTKVIDDNKKIDNMICPKCGSKLIVRNGKYGEFIGCSNYPKCKFIKK